jgi:hypothetical protein
VSEREERRKKRREMWEEGHKCSHWWDCPECAARAAEIDAKYPREEQ